MDRQITFMQYGCGKMSRYLIKYAVKKGAVPIGAFDIDPAVIGRDMAEIAGDGFPSTGVKVSDASCAGRLLRELKPDVCIIATRSTLAELEEIMTLCADAGVNAITTCEEALYPWNSSPALTKKLDGLAKRGGCTLTGVGYCDLYWGTMVTNFMGAQSEVRRIKGVSSYNVEDYGRALAEGHGAGLEIGEFESTIGKYNSHSPEELRRAVESGEYVPSYMWNQNGWLASRLGLRVVSQTQKCYPTKSEKDLFSGTLGRVIPAGQATGMRAVVTTETAEGIEIETECIGKVYEEGEFDVNRWRLEGEPDSTLVCDRPATAELTCGTLINRIPQLIDAPAGYVTTDSYPGNIYCLRPLHEYCGDGKK